jgi:hypothetical protein
MVCIPWLGGVHAGKALMRVSGKVYDVTEFLDGT